MYHNTTSHPQQQQQYTQKQQQHQAHQQDQQQQLPEHPHPPQQQQHHQQQHQQQQQQQHVHMVQQQQQEHILPHVLRYNVTKLLCDVLKRDPACISLMHVFQLLERATHIQRPLTNAILITAWGDINDLLYAFEGNLPFDIYDKVLEGYGDDTARLILNCDASFLQNTTPPPTQRTRIVPLLDSLLPLREAVAQETGEEALSLAKCLRGVAHRAASREGGAGGGGGKGFTDHPDTDMLLLWAGRFLGVGHDALPPQLMGGGRGGGGGGGGGHHHR